MQPLVPVYPPHHLIDKLSVTFMNIKNLVLIVFDQSFTFHIRLLVLSDTPSLSP